MKIDKRLKKVINNLVKVSFDSSGTILEKKILECVSGLRSLPNSKAIAALSEYNAGLKRELLKTTLTIESAVDLSSDQVKKIKNMISSERPVSNVETILNSSLLGGLRIKIGDVVFDDSVSQKIVQVKGAILG